MALRLRRSTGPRGGTPPPGSLPARPAGSGSGLRRLVRVALPRAAEPATPPVARRTPPRRVRRPNTRKPRANGRNRPHRPAVAPWGARRVPRGSVSSTNPRYAPVSGAPGAGGVRGARPRESSKLCVISSSCDKLKDTRGHRRDGRRPRGRRTRPVPDHCPPRVGTHFPPRGVSVTQTSQHAHGHARLTQLESPSHPTECWAATSVPPTRPNAGMCRCLPHHMSRNVHCRRSSRFTFRHMHESVSLLSCLKAILWRHRRRRHHDARQSSSLLR